MAVAVMVSQGAGVRTGVLVVDFGTAPMLCPFFGKCDGVLLIDAADGSKEFYQHDRADAKSINELILELKPQQLVCGFIGKHEKQTLRAAGIDVRLGSCTCSVEELVASFCSLPKA